MNRKLIPPFLAVAAAVVLLFSGVPDVAQLAVRGVAAVVRSFAPAPPKPTFATGPDAPAAVDVAIHVSPDLPAEVVADGRYYTTDPSCSYIPKAFGVLEQTGPVSRSYDFKLPAERTEGGVYRVSVPRPAADACRWEFSFLRPVVVLAGRPVVFLQTFESQASRVLSETTRTTFYCFSDKGASPLAPDGTPNKAPDDSLACSSAPKHAHKGNRFATLTVEIKP